MARRRLFHLLVLLPLLTFFGGADAGLACTLYGALAAAAEGGGVLVGKNRDLPREEEQVLIREAPCSGLAFLGIASQKSRLITSGINEKGLVIVNASASSVKGRSRSHIRLEEILNQAGSVEGALRLLLQAGMRSPIHYLLADPRHLALLEVYSPERHEVKLITEGVLTHTNHYLLPSLEPLNGKFGDSSLLRLERIRKLMIRPPFSPDQFIAFSRDHENGPGGNSICRHPLPGSKSARITVSAMVVRIGPQNPPEVWIRLGQPCERGFEKVSF